MATPNRIANWPPPNVGWSTMPPAITRAPSPSWATISMPINLLPARPPPRRPLPLRLQARLAQNPLRLGHRFYHALSFAALGAAQIGNLLFAFHRSEETRPHHRGLRRHVAALKARTCPRTPKLPACAFARGRADAVPAAWGRPGCGCRFIGRLIFSIAFA